MYIDRKQCGSQYGWFWCTECYRLVKLPQIFPLLILLIPVNLASNSKISQLYMCWWYGGKWDFQTNTSNLPWGVTFQEIISVRLMLGASSSSRVIRSWLWTTQYWVVLVTLWKYIWSFTAQKLLRPLLDKCSFCCLFSLMHCSILSQLWAPWLISL
jgi:hypothetical protein